MMDRLLERYPPPKNIEKDDVVEAQRVHLSPRKAPVERTVDLHGFTTEVAWVHLDRFVRTAARDGVRKILIVHGKGSHPGSDGAMKALVRRYVEQNPLIGATGTPGVADGGAGATWAIVRQRSR